MLLGYFLICGFRNKVNSRNKGDSRNQGDYRNEGEHKEKHVLTVPQCLQRHLNWSSFTLYIIFYLQYRHFNDTSLE